MCVLFLPHDEFWCVFVLQPHSKLVCATPITRPSGTLVITTVAGSTSVALDAATLLPLISSVAPALWSATSGTTVVIAGDR